MNLSKSFFAIVLTLLFTSQLAHAGQALRFAMQDESRVTAPDCEALDIDGQALTMEAWINLPDPDSDNENTIMNKENSYELHVRNGVFQAAIRTQGRWEWLGGNNRIQADRWYHVAATYDGQNIRIYVDGRFCSAHAKFGNIETSDDDFLIGNRTLREFELAFTGMIDEVRLWNVARTQEELEANMDRLLTGAEEGLVGYWRLDEGEGQIAADRTANEIHGFLGGEEDADGADPEWVESDAPLRGGNIAVDRNHIGYLPVPQNSRSVERITLANITEEQGEMYDVHWFVQDPEDLPEYLTLEPAEGDLAAQEEVEVAFTIDAGELEPDEYESEVVFESDAVNVRFIPVTLHFHVVEGAGRLNGRVVNLENDQPVAGARVFAVEDFDLQAATDEEGLFDFEEVPAFNYHIRVLAEDFLTADFENVQVDPNEETILNIELRYADFLPDPQGFELAMQPDDTLTNLLAIRNGGNGPLTWSMTRNFPEGVEAEPWEHRNHLDATGVTQNDRVGAVEFVQDRFFIAAGVRGDDNIVFVVNRDGELVRQFPQFAESSYGIRDLTWDGGLLWGIDEDRVFGFDPQGELQVEFASPVNSMRALTYDPDRELFWTSGITSDIYAFNRDGEVEIEIDRPDWGPHIYGLGYYPADEDGYCLYLSCADGENRRQVWKMNFEDGDVRFIAELEFDGSVGAATVSGLWDPYSWTYLTVTRSGDDAIEIYHLGSRNEWMQVDPAEGEIGARDEAELRVHFNTAGFPEEERFNAELIFTHDGIGGEHIIPVSLFVTGEGGVSQRLLQMDVGWNLVSVNVIPEAERFIDVIAPLLEQESLIMAKDGRGRFFHYLFGGGGIPRWNGLEGYYLKCSHQAELQIDGEIIMWDEPIELDAGWNMISYLPRNPAPPEVALAGLGGNLEFVRDGNGRFYIPEYEFSNIGSMREGNGYLVKVAEEAQLNYRIAEEVNRAPEYSPQDFAWINEIPNSPQAHNILLIDSQLKPGTRFESVGKDDNVYGRGVSNNNCKAGIALWGDDPATGRKDGFVEGEEIYIMQVDEASGKRTGINQFEIVKGTMIFTSNGITVIENSSTQPVPEHYYLSHCYPNPFNAVTSVEYGLPATGGVRIAIYDARGRLVEELLTGRHPAGRHKTAWNASANPSGIYFVRMEAGGEIFNRKIVLIK